MKDLYDECINIQQISDVLGNIALCLGAVRWRRLHSHLLESNANTKTHDFWNKD